MRSRPRWISARRPPSAMIRARSASDVGPTHMRVPSYVRTSRRRTLSTVLPYACADAPHELLPIMPPSAQWLCVDGLGPNCNPCSDSCRLSSSRTIPGSTTQVRASGSTETSAWQYLVQSMITAVLVACPARLVPPPRDSTGALSRAQTSTARAPASTLRGTTTPSGTWR